MRFYSKLPIFAAVFGWDPRVVERLTLLEFDVLVVTAELIEKAANKR